MSPVELQNSFKYDRGRQKQQNQKDDSVMNTEPDVDGLENGRPMNEQETSRSKEKQVNRFYTGIYTKEHNPANTSPETPVLDFFQLQSDKIIHLYCIKTLGLLTFLQKQQEANIHRYHTGLGTLGGYIISSLKCWVVRLCAHEQHLSLCQIRRLCYHWHS